MKKNSTTKKILKLISKYKFLVFLSFLFAILSVAATLYIPILIGNSINVIVKINEVDFAAITKNAILIGILIVVVIVTQYVMSIINNKITYNITYDLRKQAFEKIHHLPISYIDSHQYGDIVSRIINDVDTFVDGLLMGFTQLFVGVLTIAGTLGLMISINYIVAIVVVCLTPLSLLTAKFVSKNSYKYFKSQTEIRGEQTAFMDEMINNLKVVKAFSIEDKNVVKFDEVNDRLEKSSLKAIFFSSLVNPTTRFINAIIYAIVAFIAAWVIIKSPANLVLDVGKFSTLLSYASQYSKPFNEISGVVTELQNSIACANRVFEYLESKELDNTDCPNHLEHAKGNIKLEHVYFSYVPEQKLIQDFNLIVKQGQRVAIVGPTGCGKTTLINLLMRFYDPTSGTIYIDDLDTIKTPRKDIRNNFGMVLQETWIKNATVLENIKIGKEDATKEEVIKAAKEAHAHSFIMKMKDGYDAIIGEDGGNLSVGQKQLLCIARIMLTMPPMLILDEATSSIDTRTELKIQNAFAKLMRGKTSFIVAHRLSTIKNSDIILVMNNGNIIEQGNHNELMAKKGFYYKLYNSQFEE